MNTEFFYKFPFGAQLLDSRYTRFRLWAPEKMEASVEIDGGESFPMQRDAEGMFEADIPCAAGTRYRFRVAEDVAVPDPASRLQSGDVHDASVVVDPTAFRWTHADWGGRPWHEMSIYELHAGVLGGFRKIEARLPEWLDLGIGAIELMPVADFSGLRNWGYDGVLPYAPDTSYGTPDELKSLIDSAHGLGLCVYLDVVYNHFGPDGNYLHAYAQRFFQKGKTSPWGDAIDFGCSQVRDFFIHNALYWLLEYRFDGLRFDAVHAIGDTGFLKELAARVREGIEPERQVHLILENEDNIAELLERHFDAQWNDDAHNAVHVLLTGEQESYYTNYADAPAEMLARCLAEGFAYQGETAAGRSGAPRGTPSAHLPSLSFVFFLQNHDQVGNRAFGERLSTLADPRALEAAIALFLLSPQIPLLFMGEEWGARTPFLFFTDFHDELATAVRNGRRKEFALFSAFSHPESRERIPDPNALDTFKQSVPDFSDAWREPFRSRRAFYRSLLTLRKQNIVPRLIGTRAIDARAVAAAAVDATWQMGDGCILRIVTNFSGNSVMVPSGNGTLLFETDERAGRSVITGQCPSRATVAFLDKAS
jgi:malto-oligosyltrehalose trehalohydrolase